MREKGHGIEAMRHWGGCKDEQVRGGLAEGRDIW